MVDLAYDLVYTLKPEALTRAADLLPFVTADCERLSIGILADFANRAIARGDVTLMILLQRGLQGRRDGGAVTRATVERLTTAIAMVLGYIEATPEQAVTA